MFVLACALRTLDGDELVAYTRAMIATGVSLQLGDAADRRQALRRRRAGQPHDA